MKLHRRKFCECGCGRVVKKQFVRGHNQRGVFAWNKGFTKETHPGIASMVAKRVGRTKETHPHLASKLKGLTKETHPGIASMAEKLKGRPTWNKGLTKEVHPRLASMAKKKSGRNKYNDSGHAAQAVKMKGRTKETHSGVAATAKKNTGGTKETHASVARMAKKKRVYWKKRKDEFVVLGKPFPFHMASFNPRVSKWFQRFDDLYGTKGVYASFGNEEYKVGWYSLDYINHDLKLIMEWDEHHHYQNNKLKPKDAKRQSFIQRRFPNYKFIRIKQKTFNGILIRNLVKELKREKIIVHRVEDKPL